jgi:hypothetical protein
VPNQSRFLRLCSSPRPENHSQAATTILNPEVRFIFLDCPRKRLRHAVFFRQPKKAFSVVALGARNFVVEPETCAFSNR